MDRGTLEKVRKELERKEGVSFKGSLDDRRSLLFRMVMGLVGVNTEPAGYLSVEVDGVTKDLVVVEKKHAKEEYEKLKKIREELAGNCSLAVPEPFLLLEEENIVVQEFCGPSFSEIITLGNFFIGKGKDEIIELFKRFGRSLAEFHNLTLSGEKINLSDKFKGGFEETGGLPLKINDIIRDIELRDVSVPETRIHGDVILLHIRKHNDNLALIDWSGSKMGPPQRDLSCLEFNMKRWNVSWIRYDLMEFYDKFEREYKEMANFNIDGYSFNLSKLNFLLSRVKRKPKKFERDIYKKEITEAANQLMKG